MTEDTSGLQAWFSDRLPDDWFTGPPEITADRDEILVRGPIPDADVGPDATEGARNAARRAAVMGFRERTRARRMRIAEEAEAALGRKVSWGAECGGQRYLFTHLSVPAMTRLSITERHVLDTLIDAGVARTRSEALAWCVRLVGKHQTKWLEDLREAFKEVEKVRDAGPYV